MKENDQKIMPEIEKRTVIKYLLGELPAEKQADLEELLFTEPYYQQLLEVEEELIEAYVHRELSERERKRFEGYFLESPQRRERVEFAQTLIQALAVDRPPAASWWQSLLSFVRPPISIAQVSLAALGLIGLIGGSWLVYETWRLRAGLAQLEAARSSQQQQEQRLQQQVIEQQARNEELTGELESERRRIAKSEQPSAQPSPSSIFAFALSSLLVKGDEGNRIAIPPSAQLLRIRLELERAESYRSYRVALRKAEDQGLHQIDLRRASKTASGRVVMVSLPAGLVANGDYVITLKGETASGAFEDVADYQFSIVKR